MNKTPHIHAELIHQWADGAEIEERFHERGSWRDEANPRWSRNAEYRVKPVAVPVPVPNKVTFRTIYQDGDTGMSCSDITYLAKQGLQKALRLEINPTKFELVSAYVVSTETGEPV